MCDTLTLSASSVDSAVLFSSIVVNGANSAAVLADTEFIEEGTWELTGSPLTSNTSGLSVLKCLRLASYIYYPVLEDDEDLAGRKACQFGFHEREGERSASCRWKTTSSCASQGRLLCFCCSRRLVAQLERSKA